MFLSLPYVATLSQPQPSSQSSKNDFRFFFFFGGGSIGSCASPPSFSAVALATLPVMLTPASCPSGPSIHLIIIYSRSLCCNTVAASLSYSPSFCSQSEKKPLFLLSFGSPAPAPPVDSVGGISVSAKFFLGFWMRLFNACALASSRADAMSAS